VSILTMKYIEPIRYSETLVTTCKITRRSVVNHKSTIERISHFIGVAPDLFSKCRLNANKGGLFVGLTYWS
jgi:hypothetical protein